MENMRDYGIFLLGIGALIFSLTFLHFYLTKIVKEEPPPLYFFCTLSNNSSLVKVTAQKDLKNVRVEIDPGSLCNLGDLSKGDSDLCFFNKTSQFAKVYFEYKGREMKRVAECFKRGFP